jgi:glycyl-tRNA synthetase beta chain
VPDLLLEVGCEELPSSACREALEQAGGLVRASLEALRLEPRQIEVWVAPRRIAVLAAGLPDAQPAETRVVLGPPVEAAFDAEGRATAAAEGFARKHGLEPIQLVEREGQGGRTVVAAELRDEARPAAELVPETARRLVEGLRFSKTMRWGEGTGLRFSRPVRWIVAKLDDRTVPFELHGLEAGDTSQGHRFIGGPARIERAGDYREAVRAKGVVADHGERRRTIEEDLHAAAARRACAWRDPLGKLEEVVFLVEWPSVIAGRIAEAHMRLPPKVLVTAMQTHQRYFPLEREDGSLESGFLAVSNGDPAYADLITRGNEDVLDARLQDAAFSFDKDRAAGLAELDRRLDAIVFHQRLGTMADKRDRLVAGVRSLAGRVGEPAGEAEEAARWAKADQGAVLVAEFPELQGYAAAHYARLEGMDEDVARAIEEQYLPEGPDSPTPATAAGALLAAAEKIDNLVGAFAIGEIPKGSKDPYGLRRAAAGLVRIALERGWDADLGQSFLDAYDELRRRGADLSRSPEETLEALDAFVADRLAFQLAGEGVGAEAAAAAEGAGLRSLVATAAWARGIEAARADEAFWELWTASTRCIKIAQQGPDGDRPFVPAGDEGEDALAGAIEAIEPGVEAARRRRDLAAALEAAAPLAAAVDRFFEDVLVNAPDPAVRERRYALVRRAAGALSQVADFSKVTQGGTR